MKKTLLIIILSLSGLVLLAVVCLGVFLATFNPNEYKEQLSAAVEKVTGRNVQFQSDLEVSFFPKIGLKTGRVVITDPKIFGGEPFLTVESASLLVSLDPLLDRVIEVEEVTLSAARLHLVTNAIGRHNWEYPGQEDKRDIPAASTANEEKAPLAAPENTAGADDPEADGRFALKIQRLSCADTKVRYRDMRTGRAYSGTLDAFTLLDIHENAALHLDLSGTVSQDNGVQKAHFSIRAELHPRTVGKALSAGIERFEMQGDGFATGPFLLSGKAAFTYERNGAVTVSGLQGSFTLLPEEGAENSAAVNTEYSNGRLTFTPAEGTTAARIDGGIDFAEVDVDALQRQITPPAPAEPGEAVKGAPNLTRPKVGKATRVNPQLAQSLEELNAAKAERDDRQKEAEHVGTSGARWIDGSFAVTIGRATVKAIPIHEFRLEAHSGEGKAAMQFSLGMFKGAVNGTARISREQDAFAVALSVQAKGLDMAEATNALSGNYSISGIMEASADLAGKGRGAEDIVHSLSGKIKTLVGSGNIRGFNLIPADLPGLKAVPVNFPFERISASANVSQGVATSKDILLQSSVLAGRGGGKVHLAYGQMDLGVDLLPAGMPPAVPVSISGPFGALSYSVDVRTFLRNVAESVEDHPKDAARGLLRNIGGALLR